MDTSYITPLKQDVEASLSLLDFLEKWDAHYSKLVADIPLLNTQKTREWSKVQKEHFARVFYHVRGHFHEFLWHLGNFAPDNLSKEIILGNVRDELGGYSYSHEKLYRIFAEEIGVDIIEEHLEEKTYLPFVREFNKGHIRWLYENDWDTRLSGFAALERLDNVDYVVGKSIAESLGLKGKAVTFFNVHINVDHFENILHNLLNDIWVNNPDKVKDGFYFIADHQAKMWKNLSNTVFNYKI